MTNEKIRVVELFAGVGGFRIGLEGWKGKSASSGYMEEYKSSYKVIWSNQWEPGTKAQHASWVYEDKFGSNNHSNEDITRVRTQDVPDHDLLVGGFPCQDYSVATTLVNSKGLIGKKGVLWWSIHRILKEKKNKPKYLLLENVDRLLKSPASQRGRDFAVMLKSLDDLGYAVEWRVINAAEYGMPQRRRRVFFIGYHKSSDIYKKILKIEGVDWITEKGTLANAFPTMENKDHIVHLIKLYEGLVEITDKFNMNGKITPFENSGLMMNGEVITLKTIPNYNGKRMLLKDIIENNKVNDEFYIKKDDIKKWQYLKGAKKEVRTTKDGFGYHYSEGGMTFPDPLDKPSRTIITGEGGASASRFKHVIETKQGLRRLTPIELERLNMFPDNITNHESVSNTKRAFLMGNALVVGVIEKIGRELSNKIYG